MTNAHMILTSSQYGHYLLLARPVERKCRRELRKVTRFEFLTGWGGTLRTERDQIFRDYRDGLFAALEEAQQGETK